ncbi:unnamed protein product [Fraxinus pennsylvanica]|uniref:Uncharacterized protein n=1 Tax=Fraxinus pennsylvanica TaxID=56036 RepID=A0AAD2AER0_9LAMI|nr:unnamed protein product [Fraxinus pennsylvanica]
MAQQLFLIDFVNWLSFLEKTNRKGNWLIDEACARERFLNFGNLSKSGVTFCGPYWKLKGVMILLELQASNMELFRTWKSSFQSSNQEQVRMICFNRIWTGSYPEGISYVEVQSRVGKAAVGKAAAANGFILSLCSTGGREYMPLAEKLFNDDN